MPNGYSVICALQGMTKHCPVVLAETTPAVNNVVWGWVCKSCASTICSTCGSFLDNPYHETNDGKHCDPV